MKLRYSEYCSPPELTMHLSTSLVAINAQIKEVEWAISKGIREDIAKQKLQRLNESKALLNKAIVNLLDNSSYYTNKDGKLRCVTQNIEAENESDWEDIDTKEYIL